MNRIANKALALLLAVLIAAGTLLVPASAVGTSTATVPDCTGVRGGTAEVSFTLELAADAAAINSRFEGGTDDFDEGRVSFSAPDDFDVGAYYVKQGSPKQCFSIYADEKSAAETVPANRTLIPAGKYTFKLRIHLDAATEETEQPFEASFSVIHSDGSLENLHESEFTITVLDAPAATLLHGGEHLTSGGSYALADDATGTVYIETTEAVTISGSGVAWDSSYNYTADTVKYANLKFDCTAATGAQLTLRDMFLEDRDSFSGGAPLVNFAGAGNRLNIEGIVVMDKYGAGQGTYANIHVPQEAALTIGGAGTLYLYKTSGGAGIGGDKGEMNGEITFAMTGSAFIKGTKQGAVIGAGTGAKGSGVPGRVVFESGEYNLISNSRGAVIGGSAGSDGASEGTEVYFKGGCVNINTDYSGSSVGGGGFAEGNDASGGTIVITGGSLRTYVDKNAAANLSGKYYKSLPLAEGVNNVSMTALRKNAAGEDVYLCIVDTKDIAADADGNYTVKVDGAVCYKGGRHGYGFLQEGLDKGEQLALTTTVSNWYKNGETRLFVYLTGKDHTIQVNDEAAYTVYYNAKALGTLDECSGGSFTLTPPPSLKLDKSLLYFSKLEDTAQLTATVVPEGTEVTWKSSDDTVATVDDSGLVTVHKDGKAVVTATAGELTAECTVNVRVGALGVVIRPSVEAAEITLSGGIVYTYREAVCTGEAVPANEAETAGQVFFLKPGNYTATVRAAGYYAAQFSFAVTEDGKVASVNANKVNGNIGSYLTGTTFTVPMHAFVPSTNPGAWDGLTLDVSWYSETASELRISTPAQLAGMAAIVNGVYNAEITTILDDADGDGTVESYTPAQYAALKNAKIIAAVSSGDTSGPNGFNLVTTDDYWYGVKSDGVTPADFRNQTVRITADLDLGGYLDANGEWTGARYMTIGGQSLMHYIEYGPGNEKYSDGLSHLGASFNGKLEGEGHLLKNVYCDRYAGGSNFGDSQSVGIVGRLGIHDNDYSAWKADNTKGNYPAVNPSVRNLAVSGYIYARRSVGGIVGKIGQTSASNLNDGSLGGLIENCVNFATVHNTDSKGCGGIVGAGWNKGAVRNCANFGYVYTTYRNPTGGIVGSNEVPILNSYNMGKISATSSSYAMGIGTNNGGANDIRNCYWLTGSAPGGGYYKGNSSVQCYEVTDNYAETTLTAVQFMQDAKFTALLNGADTRAFTQAASTDAIYALLNAAGYPGAPVPRCFTTETASVTEIKKVSDPEKLAYVEGERFDPTGMELRAYWSDGTSEVLTGYAYSIDRELALKDTEITVTVSAGGKQETFRFALTVIPVSLSELKIASQPAQRAYNEGDRFAADGLKVTIVYTNGKTATAVWTDGKFVDSEDAAVVYGTMKLLGVDEPLTAAQDGKAVVVSYTFTDGVSKTVDTAELTVVPAAGKPRQENGVYLVGTPAELDWIAAQVNNGIDSGLKARLTADIAASESFQPIGSSMTGKKFTGEFDGCGHRVTLALVRDLNYTALIGYADSASVKNVIVDGSVEAKGNRMYVAGVVGQATGESIIENCGNEAHITCGGTPVGGIVGGASDKTVIRGCYNWGEISGTATNYKCVGGIVGELKSVDCLVENCYNWGNVTGGASSSSYGVGGIIGKAPNNAVVKNVYNAGKITNLYTINETNAKRYAAAIIGSISNAKNVENYWWLEGTATNALGSSNPIADNAVTDEALREKAADLGAAYKKNANGYPLLTWQPDGAHVHGWGEWTRVKEPTCTEVGKEERTCSVGSETESRDIPMLDHNWGEWTRVKEPTCTEVGKEERTCSVGNETESRDIPMLDHNWGEWTRVKDPTCTEVGKEERTCSVGSETESRDIPMLAHKDENRDYRCDDCGAVLKEAPKLLSGDGQTWTKRSGKTLTFASDADREDFLGVSVDGKALDAAAFTVADDSTTVTLTAEALEKLSVGKHTLRLISRNGEAEAAFEIVVKTNPDTPKTGDTGIFLWVTTLSASALLAVSLLLRKKREN